jgi:2-acylglycerol O-acyltransferase 2
VWWRSFFDFTVISEVPCISEGGRPFVLAEFPHGLFPTGVWLESTLLITMQRKGDPIERGVYGTRRTYCGVADAIPLLPWWRHIFGFMGATNASRGNLERILRKGENVCLYPGGIAEMVIPDQPDTENIYIRSRKGFVRLALQMGADIVPVFHFGSSQVVRQVHWGLLGALSRKLRFSLFLIIPWVFQQRVVGVLGKPIRITKKVPNPTQEEIDEIHTRFISEIQRIFESYKFTVGWHSRKLAIW